MEDLRKTRTGIKGLDFMTNGGLPQGRPSLVCGKAGTGKTIFGIECIVKGIEQFNEPGVIISFEERTQDLIDNVISLGWNLQGYMDEGKLAIDYVYIERSEIEETGAFNLDGLFIRIAQAVKVTGAKRILIDTLESLFSGFDSEKLLRAELRRLFKWLKDRGLTAIITAEAGDRTLTRYGLEEYLSDFVLFLDTRVRDGVMTRRMRLIKYRGSSHEVDEFPFIITRTGISVLPVTEVSLDFKASGDRFLTGMDKLDRMLDNKGIYRGSTVLLSGTAGSGKTSVASTIVDAACRRGEKVVYISFEESKWQVLRNTASIGLKLEKWIDEGLLYLENYRAASHGLEIHLLKMIGELERERPSIFVLDPLTSLASNDVESRNLVLRVVHYIQSKGITCVFSELTTAGSGSLSSHTESITSLMDFWILLLHREFEGYRRKTLNILKARGMNHSDQIMEMVMSENGVELREFPRKGSD